LRSSIHSDADFFVICGFVGGEPEWRTFESRWRQALKSNNLAEFKADDCEHGHGVFEGKNREDRLSLQKKLYSLAMKSRDSRRRDRHRHE
jgi:hypothetical protein